MFRSYRRGCCSSRAAAGLCLAAPENQPGAVRGRAVERAASVLCTRGTQATSRIRRRLAAERRERLAAAVSDIGLPCRACVTLAPSSKGFDNLFSSHQRPLSPADWRVNRLITRAGGCASPDRRIDARAIFGAGGRAEEYSVTGWIGGRERRMLSVSSGVVPQPGRWMDGDARAGSCVVRGCVR